MTGADLLAAALLSSGALFMLLAAVGILRMPDLYTRMSAASKASTLGASLLAIGAASVFGDGPMLAEAVALVAFLFLTAPVAAHMIGRAGYLTGARPSKRTRVDALRGAHVSGVQHQESDGVGDVP